MEDLYKGQRRLTKLHEEYRHTIFSIYWFSFNLQHSFSIYNTHSPQPLNYSISKAGFKILIDSLKTLHQHISVALGTIKDLQSFSGIVSRWKKTWTGAEVVASRAWGIGRMGLEGTRGRKLAHAMVKEHLQTQWPQEEMSLDKIHIRRSESLFA